MTTENILPGMLDNSIEYFNHEEDVFVLKNGKVTPFEQMEHPDLQIIIDTDDKLKKVLSSMCNGNKFKMLKKLAKCRFGALNFEPDFKGNEINHEFIECQNRDKCIGCNIVCKPPIINGEQSSYEELQIMRELCSNDKNSAIASNLGYKQGTFNVLKTKIYNKFNLITKQQLTKTLMRGGVL
ncbi:MAG: hypothetical protein CSA38_01845 [Flavobacteriales bacterium]|nr:MAG: hypothetical protein CSA38_01845 [Flavobacteriales bacterium]